MYRLFSVILMAVVVSAIVLFTSAISFAGGVFYIDVSGSPCVVGKSESWTFDKAIQEIEDNDCDAVFFQKEEDGSARAVNLENTVSISLEDEDQIVFWGIPVVSTGECSGHGNGVMCDGTSELFTYDSSNQTKIEIKNIPYGQAAFEVSGPGTVVFRDIIIEASCDPDKVCGPVIRLINNAKVIFQHSKIISGERVQAIVDVKNEGGTFFHNFIAFTDGESDGTTYINTESVDVFAFDNLVHVFPGDFEKSAWERIGFRDQKDTGEYGPNYFWAGHQSFTYIMGHGAVECVMIDSTKCRIDNSSLRFDAKIDPMSRNHPHVVLLKRGINDAAFIREGSNFSRTEAPVILSLPNDFNFYSNNYYAITNMGQHIRFVKSDEGSDSGSDVEEVECPGEHMEADGGVCAASPGYECKDGDCSTGEALPECTGDAVPVNDSAVKEERCKCPFVWQSLSWSMGGISTCEALRGRINPENFFKRDDSPPDDVTPSDDATLPDDVTPPDDITDDDICPDGWTWVDEGLMGGKCVLRTEDNVDSSSNVENEDGGSSGCSMIAGSQTPSYAGLFFLAIPLIALSVRRRFNR